jgi:hypothetical protein
MAGHRTRARRSPAADQVGDVARRAAADRLQREIAGAALRGLRDPVISGFCLRVLRLMIRRRHLVVRTARLADLDRALAHPVDLDRAWSIAHALRYVPLDPPVVDDDPARRGMGPALRTDRAAGARQRPRRRGSDPDRRQDPLAHAHTGIYVEEARRALLGNVGDLRRIELRDHGFDSWARRNPDFA